MPFAVCPGCGAQRIAVRYDMLDSYCKDCRAEGVAPPYAADLIRRDWRLRRLRTTLTQKEVDAWWLETPDVCAYCGISEEEYEKLADAALGYKGEDPVVRGARGHFEDLPCRMTIDRVDSDLGYTASNLAKACRICNVEKGNGSAKLYTQTYPKAIDRLRGLLSA